MTSINPNSYNHLQRNDYSNNPNTVVFSGVFDTSKNWSDNLADALGRLTDGQLHSDDLINQLANMLDGMSDTGRMTLGNTHGDFASDEDRAKFAMAVWALQCHARGMQAGMSEHDAATAISQVLRNARDHMAGRDAWKELNDRIGKMVEKNFFGALTKALGYNEIDLTDAVNSRPF